MRFIVQELIAGQWFVVKAFEHELDAIAYAQWAGGRATRILRAGKKVWPRK